MNPPELLTTGRRRVDGTVVVDVAGEVDLDTAPTLRAAITAAITEAAGASCVVDLTEVSYLGSAGLTALVDGTREADARREPLRIVVDRNRPVIRPIELTGLDHLLSLFHSVDEALAAGPSTTH